MSIETVESNDGTVIAYEKTGRGPPLILVGGAFCDRSAPTSGTPLAGLLAEELTVYSYDRRGRGASPALPPYPREREVEDLGALIRAAGGSAFVFGISSGGLLALDAAAAGLRIPKLAVYEPPVILDPARAEDFAALGGELDALVAAGRRGDAAELFLTRVVQMPAGAVAQMRKAPMWAGLEQLAHTLSADVRITARGPARLEQVKAVPRKELAALVMGGGASPPWMRQALEVLAGALPKGRHLTLEGQTHAVDPRVLARELSAFLRS